MTYAIFATTPAAYLLASKLYAEGATVVVGESAPTDRFPTLTKHPRAKLLDALARVKDKSDYCVLFDKPLTGDEHLEGFKLWAPEPVVPQGEYAGGGICVYLISHDGKPAAAALSISNETLGAGNVGPRAELAQVLTRSVPLDCAAVRVAFPDSAPSAGLSIRGRAFTVRDGQPVFAGPDPVKFTDLIPLAGLAESFSGFLEALHKPESAFPEGFGVTVGVFDLPDFTDSPRDVLQGTGQTVTEAVDDAYASAEGLYRPAFDFLGSYDGSILDRFNAACGPLIKDEPVDVEGEREARMAAQQATLKAEQDAVEAQRKTLQENFDTEVARVRAEKDAEVAAIREELTAILHEPPPRPTV